MQTEVEQRDQIRAYELPHFFTNAVKLPSLVDTLRQQLQDFLHREGERCGVRNAAKHEHELQAFNIKTSVTFPGSWNQSFYWFQLSHLK